MLSFSISYPDLIKFPYFADTTQRGDKGGGERGGERGGDFMNNFDGFRLLDTIFALNWAPICG
jgi:hypothetical protein